MRRFIKKHWLIIGILLLALFLRIYKITSVPVSLFGDELDVGYQAYSILKTGRDYYGNLFPLNFHSMAEWRTPLYLYSTVPTVFLFGITPLGVRLPAIIFGVLGVWGLFLLINKLIGHKPLSLMSSFLLAVNPWHLQYSRGGFEVTMLLAFLIWGLYLFIKSFENSKLLFLSAILLVLTPMIYSTAKLFTPFLLVFLYFLYRKEIFKLPKRTLLTTFCVLLVTGGLVSYATLFGGGSERFSYIGVFTDPTNEPEIGVLRLRDAQMRGEEGVGLQPKLLDRILHNKFVYVGEKIINNYIKAFSTDFLFVGGDTNPRHSIDGMGMFYKLEIIALFLGIVLFFTARVSFVTKRLFLFWLLMGVLPSAVTRDGGGHATRLILILPPLIFLISYGIVKILEFNKSVFLVMFGIWLLFVGNYFHNYYVHYPWDSERWWHYGWSQSVEEILKVEKDYDRVFITMADEPAWIFFASLSHYDPKNWQKGFPMKNTTLPGFGGMSYIDKYYFGAIDEDGSSIYDLEKHITDKDLYLASVREIPWNLIQDPGRVPQGLKMIKSIAYPSGEPAFYLFRKE